MAEIRESGGSFPEIGTVVPWISGIPISVTTEECGRIAGGEEIGGIFQESGGFFADSVGFVADFGGFVMEFGASFSEFIGFRLGCIFQRRDAETQRKLL